MSEPDRPCVLCERLFSAKNLTRHHCLPREKGGTMEHVELVCSQCHGMVHATFTNETLARMYPTAAKLREAPELANYLKWVRKQPATRRKANKTRRQRV